MPEFAASPLERALDSRRSFRNDVLAVSGWTKSQVESERLRFARRICARRKGKKEVMSGQRLYDHMRI